MKAKFIRIFQLTMASIVLTLALPVGAASIDGTKLPTNIQGVPAHAIEAVTTMEGATVVVTPNKSRSAVKVFTRTPELGAYQEINPDAGVWDTGTILENDEYVGSTTQVVRDIQIATGDEYTAAPEDHPTYVAWIVEYYDAEGYFLEESLHLYEVNFYDYDEPFIMKVHDIDSYDTTLEHRVSSLKDGLEYTLDASGEWAQLIVTDFSGSYYQVYRAQDEWSENEVIDVTGRTPLQSNIEYTYVQNNTGFLVDFGSENETNIEGTYLGDVVDTSGAYYKTHILHEFAGELRVSTFRVTGSSFNREVEWIATDIPFGELNNVKKASIQFNNYGKGQLVIAAKTKGSKSNTHVAVRKNNGTWVTYKGMMNDASGASGSVSLPRVHLQSNGELTALVKVNRKIYTSAYTPGSTEWTELKLVSTKSQGYNLYKPVSRNQPHLSGESSMVSLMRHTHKNRYALHSWNVVDRSAEGDRVNFKKGFKVIQYGQTGDYFYAVLKKKGKLRVVTGDYSNIFEQ